MTLYAFPGKLTPQAALQLAEKADLQGVVILGWKPDGEFFWSGSDTDLKEIQWLLTHAQMSVYAYLENEP